MARHWSLIESPITWLDVWSLEEIVGLLD